MHVLLYVLMIAIPLTGYLYSSAANVPVVYLGILPLPRLIDPNPEQPRTPDVWQTFDITLVGRTLTVIQNGKTIIDKQEIPGITGGALDSHEGEPGPIYLQGSEDGHVQFRRITITPAVE